jgi:hypothetical protein
MRVNVYRQNRAKMVILGADLDNMELDEVDKVNKRENGHRKICVKIGGEIK